MIDESNLQYLTNADGERTAVVVPLAMWEQLRAETERLQNRLDMFDELQAGPHTRPTKRPTPPAGKPPEGPSPGLFDF